MVKRFILPLLTVVVAATVFLNKTAPYLIPPVLAQTTDAQTVTADRLLQQGNEQYQISQVQAAAQSWLQALSIYRQINNRQGEEAVLVNLGGAYLELGNYSKAIEYLEKSLAIAHELHDRNNEGKALGNLGIAYLNLNQDTKAIDYLEQVLVIVRERHDHQGEETVLGNLAGAYIKLGNYPQAIGYAQEALAIAQEVHDPLSEGKALDNLGVAYLNQGNYVKAIEYIRQSLVIIRKTPNRQSEGRTLNNLGFALWKAGQLPEAERVLRDSIQIWENSRKDLGSNDANKVSLFEQQVRTYNLLQEVLIAQNQPNAALEVAEQGRARAFAELLASRLSSRQSAHTYIAPPTLQLIKQVAQQQQATLVEYSVTYEESTSQGKPEVHESKLYIWVIKPTGEITFRFSNLKPLWQQQKTSLEDLVTSNRRSSTGKTNHLQQLHQLLIQPIADLLPPNPKAHIIFLPQESLFFVPFSALQDGNNHYLIEQHTILTAPSIQVLNLTHQQYQQRERLQAQSPQDVLVAGNPIMPLVQLPGQDQPQQLPELPGAEQEAQDIAQILHTQPLIGNQATKAAILQRLPKAKIVHLATHGLLGDFKGVGIPGAIALGPAKTGQPNDGLLTADEILDMKLRADLVVLSACDSGKGKITGDGVIGLSRSLITAGVPSIIVSLWSVPDEPTASLMKLFYQNLQYHPDKAQALRQAMLATMKQYPNFKDWAGFTLIGESGYNTDAVDAPLW